MGKILGLDIGISSVGWSILDTEKKEIVDMGVRLFETADASNNQQRRFARLARRNLRRKKYRLQKVEELLYEYGFCPPKEFNFNPYELRVKGLNKKLNPEELYVALYHLAKRRGVSYFDEAEDDDKNINESLKVNKELSKEKYPCEIQLERLKKYGKVRGLVEIEDGDGNISILINVFTTSAYKREANAILKQQKKYYPQIDDNFIERYIDLITRKREFYIGPGDEKNRTDYGIYKTDGNTINSIFEELIGKCSIYTDERRAPNASYTAQEFNLLNDLNNLTVTGRKLTKEEKIDIVGEVLNSKVKNFTYKSMMKIIKKVTKLEDVNDIKGYRIDKKGNPEFHNFEVERKARMFFEGTGIDYVNFDIEKKDKFAEVLSLSMDLKTLKRNCNVEFPEFSDEDINNIYLFLQNNRAYFGRWHSFSLKLMREMREELYSSPKNQMNILMERGLKKSIQDSFKGYKYIPEGFLDEEIYNPVVRRAANQAIKIVNAIMKKYGDMEAIIIEMPRETNEKEEKKRINDIQKQNEEEKNKAIAKARNEYGITEKQLYSQKELITKLRLWYQQDGKCIYTGKVISIEDLINKPNIFEIDHIIPKSISLDDSLNNKVLVYSYANQAKGQKTPFQAFYLSTQDINYEDIKLRATKLLERKKISKTKYDLLTFEEDVNKYDVRRKFINRNLNDTRYASRVILNGLQEFMKAKDKNTQIHIIRGKFTYQLRKRWGIEKDRDESYKHHAVDATIIAASYMIGQSDGTVRNPFLQQLGKYNKKLWSIKSNREYDKEVYKLPWPSFIEDLNKATEGIKYSHKIDTKVNRTIADATLYSTRRINGEDFVVNKYKNIYDNKVAKSVIKLIKEDLELFENPNNSKILMRRHDPKTFEKLVKIINEYEGESPNPFEAYRKEHGYIRKYSRKGNGPIIKDIKYLDNKLGEHIELTKTDKLSDTKKVVLLSLKPFRTDVYYNRETGEYKCIAIKYNDIRFKEGKYVLENNIYSELKKARGIDKKYEFRFSLHKNDIVGIVYKEQPEIEYKYRFLSSKADNPNRIEVKPLEKDKFESRMQPTIVRKVLKFNKYYTDILGNMYKSRGEKTKMEFIVDNINDI
ncbi:MAG: type II CRISPR RNA-guided endonuclease Cas9 [Tissierellia bacterium]|nr:type II CRISPR RNA-guided endonuclease Cas9 [Tissierellia bacterium]